MRKLIERLKGASKRPYVVYSIVGYYATYDDALDALNHHKESSSHTLASLYQLWLPIHAKEVSNTTLANYASAYHHIQGIAQMPITDISYLDLQQIIDNMLVQGLSYSSCKKVRSLLNQLFDFAIINGWLDKSFSPYINIGTNLPVRPHKPFTTQQINRLWRLYDEGNPIADIPLLLLYTGLRASELINLKSSDVNRKQQLIKITKSKTKAGLRVIPIHPRIWSIIESRLSNKHLLDECRSYHTLAKQFAKAMAAIKSKHTTHDCRHTFATRLDDVGANYNAKRLLLGHASGNVTDGVYTHKSLAQLRKAIKLLK